MCNPLMERNKMSTTTTHIRPKTVRLLAKFIRPLCEEGLVSVPEQNVILINLKHLAEKGSLAPNVPPRLIDMEEAATMLGVSKGNFKKMEREGKISIPRKMVGTSVRYRNTDVVKYIMANDTATENDVPMA